MRVLNVGGGANRTLPAGYEGWEQHILDIDEAVKPDICCDARKMTERPAAEYDAVFCSHNLEHFYQHEVPAVLAGFLHVLKDGGAVEIHVPNLKTLIREMVERNHDIDDIWYRAPSGPVTFHDTLYGWSLAMKGGNLYYAHKCGFTDMSLYRAMARAGFANIGVAEQGPNICARGVKTCPSP